MICISFPIPTNSRTTCNQQRQQVKNVLDVLTPFACRRNAQNKNCGLFYCLGETMTFMRVNLKVCEGCGGLWFRAQELSEVYCATCATRLRAFPAPRSRRVPGRPRRYRRTAMQHAS